MNARSKPNSLQIKLLPGEVIDSVKPADRRVLTDAELNARYLKDGVRIVTEQARYPLNQILAMFTDTFINQSGVREEKYKRDPEYQRRHRWDDGRKSRLIESFLMNVPVPPIFLYEYDLARFEVMDGRQRLTALIDFYSDSFALTELEYWPELNGRKYSELPGSIRDGIDRRYLSSIILLNETSAADEEQAAFLKKLVFKRLNSGGVELSGQETRNAVYNGPLNDLCMELSRTIELRQILGTPNDSTDSGDTSDPDISDEFESDLIEKTSDGVRVSRAGRKMYGSMEDVEVVLRFYAYRHLAEFQQGLNKITEFLDEFLKMGNKFPEETINKYRMLFLDNIRFWYDINGVNAFQASGSNRHFSKITFDALMYASSALEDQQKKALQENPELLRSAIDQMYTDNKEIFGGRKTNTVDALRRNKCAVDALQSALNSIPK